MAIPGRRRRRQPRWIVLALLLTLLALAINAAVSGRDREPVRRQERLAYLDLVRPQVQDSSDQGADLADLRQRAPELGRAGITRRLERLTRESRAVVTAVAEAKVPESLARTNSLLQATVVARANAVEAVADSLMVALGQEALEPAAQALAQAGTDLETADRTYELFVRSLPGTEAKEAVMPPSRWVADPEDWQLPATSAFLATVRSSGSTAAVHDVSVLLVSLDPPPVGMEEGAGLMAAGRPVKVTVVVANVGNETETKVPVVASLTGSDGAVDSARIFTDLAPGQRRTVTLAGLNAPAAQPVTLSVAIGPVAGEQETELNTITRLLLFR